jgi:hypothetical protein
MTGVVATRGKTRTAGLRAEIGGATLTAWTANVRRMTIAATAVSKGVAAKGRAGKAIACAATKTAVDMVRT